MGFNVGMSFNPLDVYKAVKEDDRYRTSRNDQINQANISNQQWSAQFRANEYWNRRKWIASKRTMQDLVLDAKKAGISPLAALGGQGAAPANVSMPVGQGGRVSGTYQRTSPIQATITAQMVKKGNIDTQLSEEELYSAKHRNAMLNLEYNKAVHEYNMWLRNRDAQTPPKLFKSWTYNLDEAQNWHREGFTVLPDPAAGIELPETIGLPYYLAPKTYGSTGVPSFNAAP